MLPQIWKLQLNLFTLKSMVEQYDAAEKSGIVYKIHQ